MNGELADADLDEALDDAIYGFDAARLQMLLDRYGVDPNHLIDGMPMLHSALDAEVDRGIGDENYLPTGACMVVLIEAGADVSSVYLGENVLEKIGDYSGLATLREAVEHAIRERELHERRRADEAGGHHGASD